MRMIPGRSSNPTGCSPTARNRGLRPRGSSAKRRSCFTDRRLMQQIQKNGVFLKTDGEGYLISDTGAAKIVSPWREAVEFAREIEVRRLGPRLHSLYLRGSAARGTALPGRSDLDLFAVLLDDQLNRLGPPAPWSPQDSDKFHRRFPFATG